MGIPKGAAMKVGQSLAVMADSMDMPDDVRRVLSKLNDQAVPVHFEDIEQVLVNEIADLDNVFSSIDSEALEQPHLLRLMQHD